MASSTFQDVQENTDQIWKFQRYRLVFEYYDSPMVPPPFNFLAYLISLIRYLRKYFICIRGKPANLFVEANKSSLKLIKDEACMSYKKGEWNPTVETVLQLINHISLNIYRRNRPLTGSWKKVCRRAFELWEDANQRNNRLAPQMERRKVSLQYKSIGFSIGLTI